MKREVDQIIFAWWRDQSEDCARSMAAFDKLPAEIREAVNNYPLNVLPETVLKAVRIWGKDEVLRFLRSGL